jgi:hypothetical protein
LKPHGSQSHRADDVRQINDCPEKTLKTDSAGDNYGKQKRKGHDDYTADKPDAQKVPHGNPKQAGTCQLGKVGQACKLPPGHWVRDSINLKKAHNDGTNNGIQENNRKHQYCRSKKQYDHAFISFHPDFPLSLSENTVSY